MSRKAFHSACQMIHGNAISGSNYHAERMALSVGRFAALDVRHCPETPHGCRRKALALGMQHVGKAISEQARKREGDKLGCHPRE